ncbi:hypothetical protein B0H15DRAFT_587801 [Mycena belliarum]|uniref:Uncharacterized protein n=1 Tax=Mycena belliarum TaxID=1033014 RepID=A0AAD6UCA5_9AGAR|nr:hypothetical protein B0H15DRAFT_587801 [Mycena belliae]
MQELQRATEPPKSTDGINLVGEFDATPSPSPPFSSAAPPIQTVESGKNIGPLVAPSTPSTIVRMSAFWDKFESTPSEPSILRARKSDAVSEASNAGLVLVPTALPATLKIDTSRTASKTAWRGETSSSGDIPVLLEGFTQEVTKRKHRPSDENISASILASARHSFHAATRPRSPSTAPNPGGSTENMRHINPRDSPRVP